MIRPYFIIVCLSICISLSSQIDSANITYGKYKSAWEKNNFEESKNCLIELIKQNYSVPGSYYGYVYNNLGRAYFKLGALDSAEFNFQKALEYCTDTEDNTYHLSTNIYNNIALLYDQKSQYSLALDYYQKSLRTLRSLNTRNIRFYDKLSMVYLNMGISYYNLFNFTEARKILYKSLEIKLHYNLSYSGSVYFNLARIYHSIQEPLKAQSFYQKSIQQWTIEYDSNYYELANVYLEYGEHLIKLGEFSLGLGYYEKALSNFISNYGQNHTLTSNCYIHIARFYLQQRDYFNSLSTIQLGLMSICLDFNNSRVLSNPIDQESTHDINLLRNYRIKVQALKGLLNVGRDSLIMGTEKYSSEEILKFALEIIEIEVEVLHKIQNSFIDQESRLFLDRIQKDIFIDGIEISKQLYEITNDEQYLNQAYEIASIGKSLEFQFEFAEKQKLYLESLQNPLAETILELKEDIASYQNTVRLEQQKLSPDSSLILVWSDSLFNLKRSYKKKTEELLGEADSSEYWRNEIDENHLVSTQKKLRRNETLIEYSLSNNSAEGIRRMYTLVITKNDCKILESELDSSFNHNIEIVNLHLQTYDLAEYSVEKYDTLIHSLNILYQDLILPINEWISGDQVIIIPDEELYLIPFDALIKEMREHSQDPHYLIKDYSISYSLNYQLFSAKKALKRGPLKILALGHNDNKTINAYSQNLAGAEEEINEIFKLFNGERISGDLSKVELLNKISDGSILHFAMHSYSEDQALSSAYIELNPIDDSAYSNRLFDFEIGSQRILSPMVVLSSCESGSGKLYSGEGVMSLSRSFLLAGSESVIHTLWPVEDKTSSEIMIEYYKGLKRGWNKSKALQLAKLKFLENTSPTLFHPHFWAGYQITGNTQNLFRSRVVIVGFAVGGVLIVLMIVFWRYRRRNK